MNTPTNHPVDSATRECCHAVGGHTPDCRDLSKFREQLRTIDPTQLDIGDGLALISLLEAVLKHLGVK